MTTFIPNTIVTAAYSLDPDTDTVMFGSQLQNGMIVILEYPFFRGDPAYYRRKGMPLPVALYKNAYWCRVTELQVDAENERIEFMGEYADGTVKRRRYTVSMAWFVKKPSVPVMVTSR